MAKQVIEQGRNWYVIHTYSGYEDAVAKNLKQRIESLGMEDKIFNVIVPKEKKIKIKSGKRKVTVEMIVTDASWYVVRNTPRVTGFIGAGTTPLPVSKEEVDFLMKRMEVKAPDFKIDIEVGATVKISDGPFKGFEGKVSEVDPEKGKVKVLVNMFGRDTPVELDSLQVKKV
jgi:transcriptional antiterminator NusG